MAELLFDDLLLADYHQIYLRDVAYDALPEDYGEAAIARRFSVGAHAVIIHTARNLDVPVRVEWHESRPENALDECQHLVEAGFTSPSGELLIAGLTDYAPDAQRFSVPQGALGIQACLTGLETLSFDGIEGDDRYLLKLWPEPHVIETRVLKSYPLE